jgi:hypothetical protein
LTRYVETARKHGAIPVLLTPVGKCLFDGKGHLVRTLPEYVEAVKQLSRELDVAVVDLNASSEALFARLGQEWTRRLFLWLAPGEHSNYPDGKKDDSHFNEYGATEVAKLVIKEIRDRGLPLAALLRDDARTP